MNSQTKQHDELLPCPFCDGKAAYEETITERTVRCRNCSAKIVRDVSTVLPQHVWNARAALNHTAPDDEYTGFQPLDRPKKIIYSSATDCPAPDGDSVDQKFAEAEADYLSHKAEGRAMKVKATFVGRIDPPTDDGDMLERAVAFVKQYQSADAFQMVADFARSELAAQITSATKSFEGVDTDEYLNEMRREGDIRKRSGDFAEYLINALKNDPELAEEYLREAAKDEDKAVFKLALSHVLQARLARPQSVDMSTLLAYEAGQRAAVERFIDHYLCDVCLAKYKAANPDQLTGDGETK